MLKIKELHVLLKKPFESVDAKAVVAKVPGRVKREKDGDSLDITYRDAGLGLVLQGERVSTIFLYAKSKSTAEYRGELPEGLRFDMTPAEVVATLGEADDEVPGMVYTYERGLVSIQVRFLNKGNMSEIALSTGV